MDATAVRFALSALFDDGNGDKPYPHATVYSKHFLGLSGHVGSPKVEPDQIVGLKQFQSLDPAAGDKWKVGPSRALAAVKQNLRKRYEGFVDPTQPDGAQFLQDLELAAAQAHAQSEKSLQAHGVEVRKETSLDSDLRRKQELALRLGPIREFQFWRNLSDAQIKEAVRWLKIPSPDDVDMDAAAPPAKRALPAEGPAPEASKRQILAAPLSPPAQSAGSPAALLPPPQRPQLTGSAASSSPAASSLPAQPSSSSSSASSALALYVPQPGEELLLADGQTLKVLIDPQLLKRDDGRLISLPAGAMVQYVPSQDTTQQVALYQGQIRNKDEMMGKLQKMVQEKTTELTTVQSQIAGLETTVQVTSRQAAEYNRLMGLAIVEQDNIRRKGAQQLLAKEDEIKEVKELLEETKSQLTQVRTAAKPLDLSVPLQTITVRAKTAESALAEQVSKATQLEAQAQANHQRLTTMQAQLDEAADNMIELKTNLNKAETSATHAQRLEVLQREAKDQLLATNQVISHELEELRSERDLLQATNDKLTKELKERDESAKSTPTTTFLGARDALKMADLQAKLDAETARYRDLERIYQSGQNEQRNQNNIIKNHSAQRKLLEKKIESLEAQLKAPDPGHLAMLAADPSAPQTVSHADYDRVLSELLEARRELAKKDKHSFMWNNELPIYGDTEAPYPLLPPTFDAETGRVQQPPGSYIASVTAAKLLIDLQAAESETKKFSTEVHRLRKQVLKVEHGQLRAVQDAEDRTRDEMLEAVRIKLMDPFTQNLDMLNMQLAALTSEKTSLEALLGSTEEQRIALRVKVSALQNETLHLATEKNEAVSDLGLKIQMLQLDNEGLRQQLAGKIAGLDGAKKLLLLNLSDPSVSSDPEVDQRVATLQANIADLQAHVLELDDEVKASQITVSNTSQSLRQQQLVIDQLTGDLDVEREAAKAANQSLVEAQFKVSNLEDELKLAKLAQPTSSPAVTIIDSTKVDALQKQLDRALVQAAAVQAQVDAVTRDVAAKEAEIAALNAKFPKPGQLVVPAGSAVVPSAGSGPDAAQLEQDLQAAQKATADAQKQLAVLAQSVVKKEEEMDDLRDQLKNSTKTVILQPLAPVVLQLETDLQTARAELLAANQKVQEKESKIALLEAQKPPIPILPPMSGLLASTGITKQELDGAVEDARLAREDADAARQLVVQKQKEIDQLEFRLKVAIDFKPPNPGAGKGSNKDLQNRIASLKGQLQVEKDALAAAVAQASASPASSAPASSSALDAQRIGKLEDEKKELEQDLAASDAARDAADKIVAQLRVELKAAKDALASASGGSSNTTAPDVSWLTAEVQRLEGELTVAQTTLATAMDEKIQLETEKAELKGKITDLATNLKDSAAALVAANQLSVQLEGQRDTAMAERDTARADLASALGGSANTAAAAKELARLQSEVQRLEAALTAAQEALVIATSENTQLATEMQQAATKHQTAMDELDIRMQKLGLQLASALKNSSSSKSRSVSPVRSGGLIRSVIHYVPPVVPSARTRRAAMQLAMENSAAVAAFTRSKAVANSNSGSS